MGRSILTLQHTSACVSYLQAYTAVTLNSEDVVVCAISWQVAMKKSSLTKPVFLSV